MVFIGGVVPVSSSLSPGHLDKLAHLCEYLLFAWLLVQALHVAKRHEREYLWWAWIYATSYGLLIEVVQMMIPWRSADVLDALANAVGAGLGVWLGHYYRPQLLHSILHLEER